MRSFRPNNLKTGLKLVSGLVKGRVNFGLRGFGIPRIWLLSSAHHPIPCRGGMYRHRTKKNETKFYGGCASKPPLIFGKPPLQNFEKQGSPVAVMPLWCMPMGGGPDKVYKTYGKWTIKDLAVVGRGAPTGGVGCSHCQIEGRDLKRV